MTVPFSVTDARTATVIGGSGFVGRYIVRELAAQGWRVKVGCRNPDRALFLKTAGAVGQVVPMACNIRDDVSVAKAVEGAEAVINLVGLLAESGRNRFDAVHHLGAKRVAQAAKAAGAARFVQISAIGAAPDARSQYSRTKAMGEAAVTDAFPDAVILRPSVVFGPEDGFFNLFAGLARLSPVLPLFGGGKTRFQPVYVGDVADAAVAALGRDDAAGKIYELGGPEVLSFRECLERMLAVTHQKARLLPLPFAVASAQAAVLGLLPKPLLTLDQVENLKVDNVVAPDALGFTDLGVTPTGLDVILPTYLDQYRPGGRFGAWRDKSSAR